MHVGWPAVASPGVPGKQGANSNQGADLLAETDGSPGGEHAAIERETSLAELKRRWVCYWILGRYAA